MAKGSPMTAEAKERLKAVAAANKGRATLAGLDPYGWCAAFDALLNDQVEFPHEQQIANRQGIHCVDGRVFPMRWTFARSDKTNRHIITHVKLKHARDEQHEKIREVFGAVPVVDSFFAGPGRGLEMQAFWVYPVAPILRLFYAICGRTKKMTGGVSAGSTFTATPLRVS